MTDGSLQSQWYILSASEVLNGCIMTQKHAIAAIDIGVKRALRCDAFGPSVQGLHILLLIHGLKASLPAGPCTSTHCHPSRAAGEVILHGILQILFIKLGLRYMPQLSFSSHHHVVGLAKLVKQKPAKQCDSHVVPGSAVTKAAKCMVQCNTAAPFQEK